ncbi:MAG TPA: helix-turn-helix transcriptional regulator [Verrucomicrobiae bacterium]|nr:helix-turn-helix transcriptional regulator [Verrucomicrobiae bacterium]
MNKPAKSRNSIRSQRQAAGSAIFTALAWTELGRSLELSPRELQIVRGVFDDRTEFAIAADIGISPHTVHTHFERLHHKLGVADRVGLVLRVIQEFVSLTLTPGTVLPSICANRAAGRCPLLNPGSKPPIARPPSSHS